MTAFVFLDILLYKLLLQIKESDDWDEYLVLRRCKRTGEWWEPGLRQPRNITQERLLNPFMGVESIG